MIPTLNQLSRGEVGPVQKVLDTICNPMDRPIRVMDFDHTPTMMEMCIKYGEPFMEVLRRNREMKLLHATGKRGYWLRKNIFRSRWVAEIPVQIAGNPRNPLYWQYFHPDMDAHEKRKNLYKFLKKYDMAFSPIEKL